MKVFDFVHLRFDAFADAIGTLLGDSGMDSEVRGESSDEVVGTEEGFVGVQLTQHVVECTDLEGDRSLDGWGLGGADQHFLFSDLEGFDGRVKEVVGDGGFPEGTVFGDGGGCATSARPHIRCHVKGTHVGRLLKGGGEAEAIEL